MGPPNNWSDSSLNFSWIFTTFCLTFIFCSLKNFVEKNVCKRNQTAMHQLLTCWVIFNVFCCRLLTSFILFWFHSKFIQKHYRSVKQVGSRSGSNLFDTPIVLLNEFWFENEFCRARSGSKLFSKFISRRQIKKLNSHQVRVANEGILQLAIWNQMNRPKRYKQLLHMR